MRLRLREDAPGLLSIERTDSDRRWARRLMTLLSVNVFVGFLFVPSAVANPFCHIPMVCEVKKAIDFVKDPLGFLLQKLTEANIWFLRKMLELIQNTTKVDLTSAGFLKQYAIIFAASSLITVALWLIAVAKRAVRGVGLTTAIGEAIGFLLLQFVVNALTPGAIALLMKGIDEVTAVFEPYATQNFKPFLENLLKVMAAKPSEGVGQLLAVNLIMMCGALLMWIEMLVRGAAIYVAVALGPIVNAGLVDRDLWGKSKKWFGAVFAIGLSKPVLFALLGLGGAVLSDSTGSMSDVVSKTLVGALILLLAVFASATLYKWLPAFGDEMAQLHHDRKTAQSAGPAAAIDGPAQHANRAFGMHIQDALVGGGVGGGAGSAPSVKGKGGVSAAARGRAGTASATVGTSTGAAGTAAKAGVDLAKNKAMTSPGANPTDSTSGQSGQGQAGAPPASARAWAEGADSGASPASASTGGRSGTPASARGTSGSSPGSVIGPAPGSPSSSAPPPPRPRPRPAPPSSASGTTAGSGPSTTPTPPRGRSASEPPTSKDQ
ncbi:hypothetical protein [Streptomyces sp. NPDC127108]|uniref:hypothetical protein n=1 Tax=Streptomyces sp. NPDC127108 TaxID=3345361 RepID=UPI00362C5C02